MSYTENQIIALSPDDSSTKAGMQLANDSHWVTLKYHEKALWGECKGSGKNPYFTIVDLQNIAFKCSCPSRKFPCKHSLGLFLLHARKPNIFQQESALTDQVDTWISKRSQKSDIKETKESKPIDEKAQQKRAEQREEKVKAGIEELELWMKDLIRIGVQNLPSQIYDFAKNIKARMIDAQASGLAARIRNLEQINYFENHWEQTFLKQYSKLYLLISAYKQREQMDEHWKREIQQMMGWNVNKEEVLSQKPILDDWFVLSVEQNQIEQIISEKIWMYGRRNQSFGYILNFHPVSQVSTTFYMPNTQVETQAFFYPGIQNKRMLLSESGAFKAANFSISNPFGIEEMLEQYSNQLALNPFLEEVPFFLTAITIAPIAGHWYIQDAMHQTLLIANTSDGLWKMKSFSQNEPLDCFGTFDGSQWTIKSFWHVNQYVQMTNTL